MSTESPEPRGRFSLDAEGVIRVELHRARRIISKFDLDSAIGLNNENDKELFAYYLTRELLATESYNFQSGLTGDSADRKMQMFPRFHRRIVHHAQRRREGVDILDEDIEYLLDEYHSNTPERAVSIKNAVSALVNASRRKRRFIDMQNIDISKETVSSWISTWKPQIG
jgi:hypothetical protein